MTDKRKTAFVTGATKNTGYAIACKFAENGYDVYLTSRREEEAEKAAQQLYQTYPAVSAHGLALETNSSESIAHAFAEVQKRHGYLNAFVANAAHLGVGLTLMNTSPEEYDDVMNSNAKGSFFCAQQAAKLMIDTGGAIVFVSSVHAQAAIPGRIVYAASKSAICAMSRNICVELGKYGIRSNCVIAGAIWSDRWLTQTPAETARRRAQYPAGRESTPEEVAQSVWYLASEQSATITGTELVIDSGISVCLLPYDKEWDTK